MFVIGTSLNCFAFEFGRIEAIFITPGPYTLPQSFAKLQKQPKDEKRKREGGRVEKLSKRERKRDAFGG